MYGLAYELKVPLGVVESMSVDEYEGWIEFFRLRHQAMKRGSK